MKAIFRIYNSIIGFVHITALHNPCTTLRKLFTQPCNMVVCTRGLVFRHQTSFGQPGINKYINVKITFCRDFDSLVFELTRLIFWLISCGSAQPCAAILGWKSEYFLCLALWLAQIRATAQCVITTDLFSPMMKVDELRTTLLYR